MTLIERVRAVGIRRRLAPATVASYQRWIGKYVHFCRQGGRWRHPRDLGPGDVEAFLTHLARDRRLAPSTQNQATCAVLFLYRHVLAGEVDAGHLGRLTGTQRPRPVQVPTVLSTAEVERLLEAMEPGSMWRLMAQVLYGSGLRLSECCRLRVRNLDFDQGQIVVRDRQGHTGRAVMLPAGCRGALAEQVHPCPGVARTNCRAAGAFKPPST
jgi:site-specific recombinase XerD